MMPIRDSRAYDVATRLLGSLWFLLSAVVVAMPFGDGSVEVSDLNTFLRAYTRLCLVLFYLAIWALLIIRRPSNGRAKGLLPGVAAFLGTYLPFAIPFSGYPTRSGTVLLISAVFLTVGMTCMLVALSHLGRSFSIVPQSRRTVQTGPYRWLRHPLYAAEAISVFGAALQYLSIATLVVFVLQSTMQCMRLIYEERLLRETLPDYADYAAGKRRLIPYVF